MTVQELEVGGEGDKVNNNNDKLWTLAALQESSSREWAYNKKNTKIQQKNTKLKNMCYGRGRKCKHEGDEVCGS